VKAENTVRIAEGMIFSHPLSCLVLLAMGIQLVFFASTLTAQNNTVSLPTDREVSETIASYRTSDSAESVEQFRKSMPAPVSDAVIRKKIIDDLPDYVPKLRVDNEALIGKVKKLIQPTLAIYGRDSVYELILIDHDTPLVMSDSGVVLVITTGALLEVSSDDEFLGFIAHEIGHEYFGIYSIYLKHLLQKVSDRGRESALVHNLRKMLAIIELQCDAFAAITLAFAGYDPVVFIDALERFAAKYKEHPMAYHPPVGMRRQVALGVVSGGGGFTRHKAHTSALLKEIRSDIVEYRRFKILPIVMSHNVRYEKNRS